MKQQQNTLVIGNQSAYSAADWLAPFEFALANGFNAFEWFPDKKPDGSGWDSGDISAPARAGIRQRAADAEMKLSLHAPWWADIFTAEGRAIVLQELDFAQDIGAGLLNIHLYTEHGIDAYISALRPLAVKAAQNNITVAIENTPLTGPADFNRLFQTWRATEESRHCNVCMCLDVGHANLFEGTRNDYIAYLNALERDLPIGHVHLHENHGDHDSHLTIFTGPSAHNDQGVRLVLEILRARHFAGAIILEQWPQPPELLLEARRRLQEIHSSLPHAEVPASASASHSASTSANHSASTTASTSANPKKSKPVSSNKSKTAAVGPGAPSRPAPAQTVEGQKKKAIAPDRALNDSARRLARLSTENLSWRRRLMALLKDFLQDADISAVDRLGYSAVYLQLLATAQLPCVEESGHHRPNHVANLARDILQVAGELATEEERWLLRRIVAFLPSFDSSFTRSEPLTRIRDIAHRNDIPSHLKSEIKGRLQNKLHRSAGPEDLLTARELQERFRADPAHYPADFLHQFELFMGELEDFFNASNVARQLTQLPEGPWLESVQAVRPWLEHLPREQLANTAWVHDGLEKFHQLRARLAQDDYPLTEPLGQKLHLLDIGLEDTLFALLSQALNEALGSTPEASGTVPDSDLEGWVSILVMALRHLALSGVSTSRTHALLEECADLTLKKTDNRLRIYSWARRVLYFSEELSQARYARLQPIIDALAPAFSLEDYFRETFAEGVIRGSLLFQIAKIAAALSDSLRGQLGFAPWDVIVPGSVQGVLEYRDELPTTLSGERRILLIPGLNGDEAIPSIVAALVIRADLPHLSHVAIRARQQGVVIVCLNRPEEHQRWRHLQGMPVRLSADDSRLELVPWQPDAAREGDSPGRSDKPAFRLPGQTTGPVRLYRVGEFEVDQVGPKALASRRLHELARQLGSFAAPDSWGIPFAALAEQIRSADCSQRIEKCLTDLQRAGSLAHSEAILAELRTLYRGLTPLSRHPDLLMSLPREQRYAVRSSSNCEDLEGLSGAGWHSSELAVAWEDIPKAIASVWSSLWNEAAVAGRFEAGIAQREAQMAVLLQPMLAADYCFIIHTVNPVSGDADQVYIELAHGLGEILTSARYRGEPYRLVYAKQRQQAHIKNYASYLWSLHPGDQGVLQAIPVNYQASSLWTQPRQLIALATRLGQVAVSIEAAMGGAQDIEGCVLDGHIHIVQTRPQNVKPDQPDQA